MIQVTAVMSVCVEYQEKRQEKNVRCRSVVYQICLIVQLRTQTPICVKFYIGFDCQISLVVDMVDVQVLLTLRSNGLGFFAQVWCYFTLRFFFVARLSSGYQLSIRDNIKVSNSIYPLLL